MSLFERLTDLMHESLTLYRFVRETGRGDETFGSSESISPVRLVRKEEVVYDDRGIQVRTRGELVMDLPSSGIVKRRDKIVMDEGEVYRVFAVREPRDLEGFPYLAVTVI